MSRTEIAQLGVSYRWTSQSLTFFLIKTWWIYGEDGKDGVAGEASYEFDKKNFLIAAWLLLSFSNISSTFSRLDHLLSIENFRREANFIGWKPKSNFLIKIESQASLIGIWIWSGRGEHA